MVLENTDKAMAELLEKLPDIIKGASDQLPDIASQMLVYGAFNAQVGIFVGIGLLAVALISGAIALFSYDGVGAGIIATVTGIIGVIALSSGISTAYKIEYAPKLYLLEKAVGYTKN